MKKIILTLTIMLLSYFGYGQQLHQYYTVFKRSVNYQHITGGNEYFGNVDHDDYTIHDRPLGFTFNYNGQNYTTVNLNTNGALRFGSNVAVDYTNDLESTTCTDVIAPLWDDLYIRAADNGKIIYKTEGTAPYRRFIVEWRDISWRSQGSTLSFKAILYETTNNIEFQYGPANLTDTNRSASIGLSQGTSGTNFLSVTPTSDYMTVSAGVADNTINTNQYPGNGTTFEFKHMTYVPDNNLEQAIIDRGWDTTIDDYVLTYNIKSATFFGPTNRNISDATGVEDMQMLTALQLGHNNLSSLTNLDNRHLVTLGCEANNITQIDVTRLPALKNFNAPWNNIQQIDLTQNPDLEFLHIFSNQISQIDLTQNPNLTDLNIEDNNLTHIDLSQNPNMVYLRVGSNQLSALDVSNMPDLQDLYCSFNQITTLDLSQNTQLRDVVVHHNLFDLLDLRATANAVGVSGLRKVNAQENPNLQRVLLDNQHNSNLEDVDITDCPQLYCVSVDDEAAANAGIGVYANFDIDPNASYSGPGGCPDRTYVPDANFEAYLEANGMGDGVANNHYVHTGNISGVTSLDVSNQNIADLTGIEDFAALINLNCSQNQLTSLDVTHNTNLGYLYCYQNPMTSLHTEGLTSLVTLYASQTQLVYIDVSQNPQLHNLYLAQTNMQFLDLRNMPQLEKVYCYNAFLTGIELNNVPNLKWLYLSNNQLTNIDMDDNSLLERVDLRNNHLGELHIQNGANNLLSGTYTVSGNNVARFRATGNPNLTCIFVDDARAANSGAGDYADWEKDATATYVQNTTQCNNITNPTTYVPDDNFEAYLEANGMGNGTANDNYVYTANIENVTNLDVHSQNIADLTGIEDFSALQTLNCSRNQLTNLDVSQNTNLQTLSASYNNLSVLDVSQNTNLTTLYASSNNINTLHLSNSITMLYCGNNQLTSLDVSALSQLTNLSCNDNQLTVLDVSNNHALTQINCSNNQLTSLDLSNQQDIADIACSNNQLTELIISEGYYGQSDLMYLFCDHNQLTALDLSGFETLEEIECQNNQLEGLNVANGNYTNFGNLNFTNNPNLTCIEVDDVTYMDNHWASAKDAGASYSTACHYDETYVPDDNFEHYLETHDANGNTVPIGAGNSLGNGIDGDDYVSTSKIETVTGLDIHGLNIADLTGIEDFTNLISLLVYDNQLTSLDVHHNHYLQYLYCHQNQLTDLNVFRMRYLEVIWAHLNQFSSLDVSWLISLKTLYVGNNQLTSLDVSNNAALENLYCYSNQLTSLDVSQNADLKKLWAQNNQLTSLDVDSNPLLEQLWCQDNQLTELHIQNGANNLLSGTFTIGSITYARMRATGNPDLTCIYVDDATSANNGANFYHDWEKDATATYVADAAECQQLTETYVPDDNFEHYLETHNNIGNPVPVGDPNSLGNGVDGDNYVTTSKIENLIGLYIYNQNISDLTGIEDFTALQILSVFNNQLTSLDLSSNTNLQYLYCQDNQLTSINISQNTALKGLYAYDNQLGNLDVSNNPSLQTLYCYSNQLTSLDVSQNADLKKIWVHNNQLTALDVDANPLLEQLWCQDNQLTELHIQNGANNLLSGTFTQSGNTYARMRATGNPDLTCIYVDNAAAANNGTGDYQNWEKDATATYVADAAECQHLLETYVPDDNFEAYLEANGMGNGVANDDYVTTANIENVTTLDVHGQNISDLTGIEDFAALTTLYCYQNQLTNLDVTQNTALTILWCNDNQLSDLNISQNTALLQLYCSNNQITALDISQNIALIKLNCFDNQLTTLDTSHNINLTELYCGRNQLSTLDLSQNAGLTRFSSSYNQLTDLNLSQNTDLIMVKCNNNQLTGLNVKNGYNTAISDANFDATGNPDLTCIQVDDAAWSTTNWTNIDATASFSEDCSIVYYSLTVNTTGNGSVSPSNGTYADGTVVTLTATSDAGWEFAGWSGDLTGTNNPATITMDADKTVTATFTRIQHTLTVNTIGNGSVSLSPAGGTYDEGTTVTLTATPDAGWEFAGWSGDLTGTNNPATITMDADKTVMAMFTQLAQTYVPDDNFEHYLEHHDASGNVVALGAPNSMGNGVENDNYVLTSRISTVTYLRIYNQNIADLTGIQDFTALTNIYCNGNNITSVDFSHNTNLILIDMGYNQISSIDLSSNTALETLSASFNQLTDLDVSMLPNFVSLDVSRNHLTSLNVKNGNNTNFTRFNATNNPNLTCIQVDDAAWSTTNWTNIDATASFSEDCSIVYYSLTVNTTGNGSVSPSSGTYADGTVVNLTATPDAGWEFAGWSGDLTGTNNPATITMDADKTVTATFTRIQHTLTVNTTGNGSVSLSPAGGTYDEGTTVTLTATPDAGWEFAGWSGDLTGTNNPATITMDADKTVTATFTRIQHTLTVNTIGNGSVSLSPVGGTYDEGTTVTLTATPDAGWEFAGWSGDLNGVSNPAAITMNTDKTVTATFNQLAQTYVPDDNFEAYLEANGMGNGIANDDSVTTNNINTVTNLDVSGQNIADMTGIQDFAALQTLNCSNNQLTDLDVSGNTSMISLNCSNNQLTGLDVRNGNNANFTAFDATNNPDLTCIFVDDSTAAYLSNWNIDSTSHFVANQTECDNVGIDDEVLKSMLKVYPNPVSDQLIVQSETYKDVEVRVYSLIGQELVRQKSNNGNIIVNLKLLPAATYVVKITIDGRSVYYNVIKE